MNSPDFLCGVFGYQGAKLNKIVRNMKTQEQGIPVPVCLYFLFY